MWIWLLIMKYRWIRFLIKWMRVRIRDLVDSIGIPVVLRVIIKPKYFIYFCDSDLFQGSAFQVRNLIRIHLILNFWKESKSDSVSDLKESADLDSELDLNLCKICPLPVLVITTNGKWNNCSEMQGNFLISLSLKDSFLLWNELLYSWTMVGQK